jgi:glyoxylate/hydroxypyruvate reductase A
MSDQGVVIPFAHRIGAQDVDRWLEALRKKMPTLRIVPIDQLDESERAGAEVAIVVNPDPRELRNLPSLLWVHSLWAGVEHMVAEPPGGAVRIVRLEDPHMADTMAEAVLAWVLYLHRDMPHYRANQNGSKWSPLRLREAANVTVGVLGMGNMGRTSTTRLLQHGFRVAGWSRTAAPVSGVEMHTGPEGLTEILRASDIVVVLLPLTNETHGLLNESRLKQLPAGSALINFARGAIVDVEPLVSCLDSGDLRHAVIDVFDSEPLPADSPLWSHPKVTVLPHIAAPTNLSTASRVVAQNIGRFLDTGEIPTGVDLQRGY